MTAVLEEGAAQRVCGLKMADREKALATVCSSASKMDEPVAKRSKFSPLTNHGPKSTETDHLSCVSAAIESREVAGNCAQPAEKKEAKPVMMAVEQAPASRGGDNNGLSLPVSEPHKPAGKLSDSTAFGATEEDFLGHDDMPPNGLAVTPEHIDEEDDRSSHASSSDWTPQPQISK
ncbi:hypothetical protein XENOCAPTIV_008526 [Xenoophorus captivus]|uniref:Uncharacterized protein n=1 Tax=Xenoophorus captivus TaxID=1517983 RepID=A0ABV0RPL6_9TELE